MDASAAITVTDPAVLPEDRARLDRQLDKLDRLADLGLEIAEALAAQAKGSGPVVVEGDLALAYDRVARAVRMAVMLQSRLIEDQRAPPEARPAAPADPAAARKDQIARVVRRVAERDPRLEPFQMAYAARLARERLEHDDIYGQVMSQPISDVVADICADLGLTPDWARLAREAWAMDEIDSGDVGEALQDLLARHDDDPPQAEDGEGDPPPSIPTFEDRLQALVHDPDILAAARRDSG